MKQKTWVTVLLFGSMMAVSAFGMEEMMRGILSGLDTAVTNSVRRANTLPENKTKALICTYIVGLGWANSIASLAKDNRLNNLVMFSDQSISRYRRMIDVSVGRDSNGSSIREELEQAIESDGIFTMGSNLSSSDLMERDVPDQLEVEVRKCSDQRFLSRF